MIIKKITFLLITLLIFSVNIFAFDFPDFYISTGGGVFLGYTFTRYTLGSGDINSKQNMDRFDVGGFVFADFTYAELSVMYQYGYNRYSEKMYDDNANVTMKGIGQEMSLGFSLLGKYPFKINEKLTWFPMLGITYHIALQQLRQPDDGEYAGYVVDRTDGRLDADKDKDGNPYSLSAWNSFWINIGAGADYNLTDSLFIRGEFLFGFRLPTSYEMGALDVLKSQGVNNPSLGGLTGNPTLRIAVGYKFKPTKRSKDVEEYIEVEAEYMDEEAEYIDEEGREEWIHH